VSELIVKAKGLELEIVECERKATDLEAEARALRARRAEAKQALSELHVHINQAVSQQTAANAANAAAKAQQAAEASKTETAVTLDRVKQKEQELDAKLARLDAVLAKSAPSPNPES
jgi:chromosome segregation ATPase